MHIAEYDLEGGLTDGTAAAVLLRSIKQALDAGTPVLLRRFLDPQAADALRSQLHDDLRRVMPEKVHAELGAPNYIRFDNEEVRPRLQRDHLYRRYHGWPWNADASRSRFDETGLKLVALRNRLFGSSDHTYAEPPYAPYYTHWTAVHYPAGGGFLTEHSDRLEPGAELECLLFLSAKGRDFSEGGLYLRDEMGQKLCLDEVAAKGDVIIFNQAIPHGVDPIDPGERIDWHSIRGRWSLFIPVRPSPWDEKAWARLQGAGQ